MAAKGEMSKEYRERLEILNEISSEMWDSKRQLSREVPLTGMRELGGQSTKEENIEVKWAKNWRNF